MIFLYTHATMCCLTMLCNNVTSCYWFVVSSVFGLLRGLWCKWRELASGCWAWISRGICYTNICNCMLSDFMVCEAKYTGMFKLTRRFVMNWKTKHPRRRQEQNVSVCFLNVRACLTPILLLTSKSDITNDKRNGFI